MCMRLFSVICPNLCSPLLCWLICAGLCCLSRSSSRLLTHALQDARAASESMRQCTLVKSRAALLMESRRMIIVSIHLTRSGSQLYLSCISFILCDEQSLQSTNLVSIRVTLVVWTRNVLSLHLAGRNTHGNASKWLLAASTNFSNFSMQRGMLLQTPVSKEEPAIEFTTKIGAIKVKKISILILVKFTYD